MPQLKTFSKRSGNFRQLAEEFQRRTLAKMAAKAVEVSPVDTAAYVDSFGFNNPQGYSSKDRPRQRPAPSTDPAAAKARNTERLQQEASAINLSGPVVFGNSAPHAAIVEGGTKHQAGEQVLAKARREFTRLAREALQETKQK